jgi:hypothetical protein
LLIQEIKYKRKKKQNKVKAEAMRKGKERKIEGTA